MNPVLESRKWWHMRKLHFGCGGREIGGWESYDIDVDLTKPLAFADQSVDYILSDE